MKKVVVFASVAGLASMAAGQSASLHIVPPQSTIDWTSTSSITLSIYATADFGTHIAGGEFALDGSGCAEDAIDMQASAASWGAGFENDRGYAGNGDHSGLVFGQLIFPPVLPPHVDSYIGGGNFALLGTVVVTFDGFPHDASGEFRWGTTAGLGAFALEIYDEADGSFTQLTDVNHSYATVTCIPAPSSVGLIGISGLIGVRRRR